MGSRFVGYIRVSTRKQELSGLGLEAQQATIRAYVEAHGGELVNEYREVESGGKNDRPELAKALRQCKLQGCILLIARLDRLTRNAMFLFQLQESDVDFVACDLPGANKFTLRIMIVLAEQERDLIKARTKDALARAKANGKKLGHWSHRTVRDTLDGNRGSAKGLEAVKARADARAEELADIVHDLRAKGLSLSKMASWLNEKGYLTARGGRWHPSTVRNLLLRLDAMQAAGQGRG